MAKEEYGPDSAGIYRSVWPPVSLPSDPFFNFVKYLFLGPAGRPSLASKPALIDAKHHKILTFGQFRQDIESVAHGLASLGVKQGDIVLILLSNGIYYPVIFYAILALGAVATTMNPINTESEIARQLKHSGSTFIITSYSLVQKIKSSTLPLVLLDDGGSKPAYLKFTPFEELLRAKSSMILPVIVRQSDTAVLLYSSGTTGLSKGVLLSHGNLIAGVAMIGGIKDESDSSISEKEEEAEDTDVAFALVPLFHVAGLMWLACKTLRSGATIVILPQFDFVDMLEAVQKYKVTYLPIVPPIIIALLKHPLVNKYDLSSLKIVGSGAAPLGKDTIDAFVEKYPHVSKFSQGYGLTESTGVGAAGSGPFGSAGRIMPNVEVKIVDLETGKSLPPYKNGEIWLRGPFVMQGYLNNPEATSETVDKDGWLHTGDLVYVDKDGYLFVVDRLKELIKYKGFQVPPAELEALLLTHPGISDCAVVPFPDEDAGEIPFAYIVRNPGSSLTESEVIQFVAHQVSPHKRIRKVSFLNSIPKSAAGKIQRKELKELAHSKL